MEVAAGDHDSSRPVLAQPWLSERAIASLNCWNGGGFSNVVSRGTYRHIRRTGTTSKIRPW